MTKAKKLDQVKLAEAFKALSNPHRLSIYMMLADCCGPGATSCDIAEDGSIPCVGDLGKRLDIAQSTLSHHLKELARARLITLERRGKQVVCGFDHETFGELKTFFSEKSKNPECC